MDIEQITCKINNYNIYHQHLDIFTTVLALFLLCLNLYLDVTKWFIFLCSHIYQFIWNLFHATQSTEIGWSLPFWYLRIMFFPLPLMARISTSSELVFRYQTHFFEKCWTSTCLEDCDVVLQIKTLIMVAVNGRALEIIFGIIR